MKHSKFRLFLCIIALVLGVASCTSKASDDPDSIRASGFIEGRIYTLTSALGGRIEEVRVEPGEVVEAGELLIGLDSTQLDFARDQAQAAMDAFQAQLSALLDRPSPSEVAEAKAGVDIALAELDAAGATLDLLKSSFEPLDPPQAEVNAAESAISVAGAGLTLAQAQLAQVEAGPLDGEGKILEASIAESQANLQLVERQLEELRLVAPQDGVVQQIMSSEGEVVAPGSPIVYLLDPDHLILTLYIPVVHIANIQLGDGVEITADAYPEDVFMGSIIHIADEAQFTPATVLTEEERVKLVFAVEILIDDPSGKLKPGMPVDALMKP